MLRTMCPSLIVVSVMLAECVRADTLRYLVEALPGICDDCRPMVVVDGGINDKEQVSGYILRDRKGTKIQWGVVWDRVHGLREMGTLYKDKGSIGRGINNNEVAVGSAADKDHWEAVIWTETDGFIILGDLPGGQYSCIPYDINDHNVVTGISDTADDGDVATQIFIWDAERGIRPCGSLAPGRNSHANAINNSNVIVGWSEPNGNVVPIIWDEENGMRRFRPEGEDFKPTSARDINDLGQIVGSCRDSDNLSHAYLWDPQEGFKTFRLSNKPEEWSRADFVNNHGVVIGAARVGFYGKAYWVWDRERGIRDINTILAVSTPEELRSVEGLDGINNRGQIIGHVDCASCRGVLISPVLIGDANCDGAVDFSDVDSFVSALIEPPAPADDTGVCAPFAGADVNEDAQVDFDDIEPFVWCCLLKACD